MAKGTIEFNRIIGGIADYDKEASSEAVAFARRIDFRSDPRKWRLQPKTVKESGTVITGLPKWGERVNDTTYIYDEDGNVYSRTLAGAVTKLHQVAGSSGNGLKYFGETDFLYFTTDTAIGRYGYVSGSNPTWVDDFLTAEGGVPTNTHSLDLEASSSQYVTAADSATLSVTGDITLELYAKLESLPATGGEMVLLSKWNGSSDERSYKMVITGVAGVFGDGSDGALTISADTTQAPTDSACTGTTGTKTLSATNASFAATKRVLIHQTQGTGAGTWQLNTISSYTAGTITLEDALNATYTTGAQVIMLPQYTNVTVNSTKTWTAKAWTGTLGGILAFLANGTVTVTGTITAKGRGFVGGAGLSGSDGGTGQQGEGTDGTETASTAANSGGGGGGYSPTTGNDGSGGGGGGHATAGTTGAVGGAGTGGTGGGTYDTVGLTTMTLGSGGGGGADDSPSEASGTGGTGGGVVAIFGTTVTVGGAINAGGNVGGNATTGTGGGGGGAGGAVLIRSQVATLGTGLVTATGGTGGNYYGGTGGSGYIQLDYITSYTGTTTPTLSATQDTSLEDNTVYHLRFHVSNDGTATEYYTAEVVGLAIDTWNHYAVAWDASASTAYMYVNATLISTVVGTKTAIYNGTALLGVGADFSDAGAARNFFDGKVDEMRIWDDIRTASELSSNRQVELAGNEANLKAYLAFDSSVSDITANANNGTLVNTPTYSGADVPFSAPTTRRDIDQSDASTGDTYALGTVIDEGASYRQTFVPSKDPQKSISVNISDTGDDSDWTLIVHDALNRTMASKTVAHADLSTGSFEFVFDNTWTPVIGATYHFHLYATTTTGTPLIVSGTSNNLETAQFKSYYQFLITDTEYHPIEQVINKLVIGNGRYVATLDGSDVYDPHRLTLPSTFKVRCFAPWREFTAIGIWKGSNVEDYDKGYIFFWDGFSETYNFYIEVPEGAINSMVGSAGTLYISAGYKGDILQYTGGDKAYKVKRLPKISVDKQLEILPGAMTMWQTLLRIGAGATDSSVFEQGVYTYGSLSVKYEDFLTYDHYISTETTKSTGVRIGMLLPVKKKLLIGWEDGANHGLDSIDLSSDPVTSGSVEFVIKDQGSMPKEKLLDLIRTDFEPLNSGESVGLQYKLDRQDDWSNEETEDTVDAVKLRYQLGGSATKKNRHREFQLRLNMYTSTTTSPYILGVSALENELSNEKII